MKHHIGVSFKFHEINGTKMLIWKTACGMRFTDNTTKNIESIWRLPENIVNIPGVGKLIPEWCKGVTLHSTDCEMCDRYIQLRILAEAKL